MTRVLYLTYDGITDPLGQSQVLPYVFGLRNAGYEFAVVSCEKPARFAQSGRDAAARMAVECIDWYPVRYTKRPPVLSTVWDILKLRHTVRRLHRAKPFDLVHCRGYVTMLAGMALKMNFGTPIIFDMRGFWPDEKVDAGAWRLGNPVYRAVYAFFKERERSFLRESDGIVVLTQAGMAALLRDSEVPPDTERRVIPCSVDFAEFAPASGSARAAARKALGIADDALVVTYLGSLGTWYMLDEMIGFFARLRERVPRSRLVLITPDDPSIAHGAATRHGVALNNLVVRYAWREQVPALLAAADLGLFFIRPTPSKVASSPTKLGEYLAMGIPVITNEGIGDVDAILARTGGGVLVKEFSPGAYDAAVAGVDRLRAADRQSIRSKAREIYDLDRAVREYAGLYRRVLDCARP